MDKSKIVRLPRRDGGAGGARTVDGLVELVDLYPTLCELAGLPLPEGLEGTSFAPLLDDPARPWKRAAFTQAGKPPGFEQRSLRTARWRYTRWTRADGTLHARELYDHERDPGETVNLAGDEALADVVAELDALLAGGPRAALPPAEPREDQER
jgi:arylsulfatase A-like enzyme